MARERGENSCAGRDGTGGCRFAPVVFIGGDPACSYHVVTLMKLRLREVGKPIKVELNEEGPWKR